MKLKYAALAVATALTLVACGKKEEAAAPAADKAAAPAPAAEVVVKIGHAAPLSGPVAHLGKDTEYGVGIALDEANAEGVTIAGQKVKFELVSEDDQADPKTATQVAQRFIDNKVAGVIGQKRVAILADGKGRHCLKHLPFSNFPKMDFLSVGMSIDTSPVFRYRAEPLHPGK